MALVRLNDFVAGTLIQDSQVDAEFNQLVEALNGVASVDILHKHNHAANPVLNVNQLGAGLIQRWQQNSVDVSVMNNRGYIIGVPKCIRNIRPLTGNVLTGLDNLDTFGIPANTLFTDGDFLDIEYLINFAANDNDKRIQFSLEGTAILNTTLSDIDQFGAYVRCRIRRLSATTVDYVIHISGASVRISSTPALVDSQGFVSRTDVGVAFVTTNLGSTTLDILLDGEATATNDIRLVTGQIFVTQMA